jgi:hypothetical protein
LEASSRMSHTKNNYTSLRNSSKNVNQNSVNTPKNTNNKISFNLHDIIENKYSRVNSELDSEEEEQSNRFLIKNKQKKCSRKSINQSVKKENNNKKYNTTTFKKQDNKNISPPILMNLRLRDIESTGNINEYINFNKVRTKQSSKKSSSNYSYSPSVLKLKNKTFNLAGTENTLEFKSTKKRSDKQLFIKQLNDKIETDAFLNQNKEIVGDYIKDYLTTTKDDEMRLKKMMVKINKIDKLVKKVANFNIN